MADLSLEVKENVENISLKDINYILYNKDGNTYLTLEGEYTDEITHTDKLINIARICLNKIKLKEVTSLLTSGFPFNTIPRCAEYSIEFNIEKPSDITLMSIEKEMTKEEIEKELGYKIKIKNE